MSAYWVHHTCVLFKGTGNIIIENNFTLISKYTLGEGGDGEEEGQMRPSPIMYIDHVCQANNTYWRDFALML